MRKIEADFLYRRFVWRKNSGTTSLGNRHEHYELIFVGLNGYAVALHRETGEIVWYNNQMKSGYVTLLLDGDRLIVSTNGYLYCLDPLTGEILWNNPMKGYGMGTPTSLVSTRGQTALQATFVQQAAAHAATQRGQHGAAGS